MNQRHSETVGGDGVVGHTSPGDAHDTLMGSLDAREHHAHPEGMGDVGGMQLEGEAEHHQGHMNLELQRALAHVDPVWMAALQWLQRAHPLRWVIDPLGKRYGGWLWRSTRGLRLESSSLLQMQTLLDRP